MPKFRIKTVNLGIQQNIQIETDEFLTKNIKSAYYSPDDFLLAKLPHNQLSVFHVNISSQSHMDELKLLLNVLYFHFDIVAISESRLHSVNPIRNVDIEGCSLEHVPTSEQYMVVLVCILKNH